MKKYEVIWGGKEKTAIPKMGGPGPESLGLPQ